MEYKENMDNIDDLKEQMYRKGFGTDHNVELAEKINSPAKEFDIEHYVTMKNGDQMGYRIHFDRSEKDNKVYLNAFTAGLLNDVNNPGIVREHTFPSRFLITAAEAYRMLKHGTDVAVNKNLYNKAGEKYNTWISLDTSGPKDDYNNYPEVTFHQNYYGGEPFKPTDALLKFQTPIKELQYDLQIKKLDEQLRKANIVPVLYKEYGEEKTGLVYIVPKNGGAILRDENGEILEQVATRQRDITQSQQNTDAFRKDATQEQDLKKKPGGQVTWNRDPKKGMRP